MGERDQTHREERVTVKRGALGLRPNISRAVQAWHRFALNLLEDEGPPGAEPAEQADGRAQADSRRMTSKPMSMTDSFFSSPRKRASRAFAAARPSLSRSTRTVVRAGLVWAAKS